MWNIVQTSSTYFMETFPTVCSQLRDFKILFEHTVQQPVWYTLCCQKAQVSNDKKCNCDIRHTVGLDNKLRTLDPLSTLWEDVAMRQVKLLQYRRLELKCSLWYQ